ncbi:MAG: helix-turn-helix domain-containing protein [Verrucomicrobiales bacterium]
MTTSSPELVTTGEHLAGARSARGMSIEDVAHVTRMPASHVRALEAGEYEDFDGVAYAKSFLRLYGNFLGVDVTDGIALLEENRELSGKSNHYPFLDAPDKIRFSSEMRAPRSSSIPLIAVLLGLLTVVSVPIAFLMMKHRYHAGTEQAAASEDAAQDQLGSGARPGVMVTPPLDLEGIATVPEGQLERIRTQKKPEVRRAEVVDEDDLPLDEARAASGDVDAESPSAQP